MNDKKNIDKLFKEQLKNFEVAPKDHVWENIQERLHEEPRKKRRVIPIWWKLAGIAAGIILFFTVANQVFNTSEKNEVLKDVIVDDSKIIEDTSKTKDVNKSKEQYDPSDDILQNDSEEQIANSNSESNDKISDETDDKKEKNSVNKNKSNSIIGSDQKDDFNIASESSNSLNDKENKSQNSNTTNSNNKTKSNNDYKELLEEKKTPLQKPLTKDAVAKSSNTPSSESNKDSKNVIKNKSEIDKILKSAKSDTNTSVVDTDIKNKDVSDSKKSSTEGAKNNTIEGAKNNEDTNTTIAETENTDQKEDVNAIENAIAEAEDTDEKEEEEEKLNRWSVSPNVAPVYFSSLGEGSPLDNQFVENTKESEINMSYGIKGSYAVNKKFKIRAGINKVQMGYKTNDVLIFENTNPVARSTRQIANVDLVDSMSQHSIYSARSFKFENAPATLFTKEQGSLDQQLGFIEVPIEIEYSIVEKKIGLNIIGGFSTLFLSDNDVYAVLNNGDRTRLGEASNIKDLSYTANFGIGFDYNFSKQFQFNLEPVFKYQINTFNNTSGDFNPYFIGVYTGLSFKF
ncbi:hypothetical protein [Psychroserpens sp.]|uniref:hypothetical protein n=1 Tax=Psychroserpens sp. TaxID=2020870 RepID=UPI00385DAD71